MRRLSDLRRGKNRRQASLLTNWLDVSIFRGGSQIDILKALRGEEKKIQKHVKSAAQNLETVRASIKVFAGSVDSQTAEDVKGRQGEDIGRPKEPMGQMG